MLSLQTLQRLLVLSAVLWTLFPRTGGFAFGATWVLLTLGTMNRTRRARAILETHLGTTLGALTPEAQALAKRFPLATVWPSTAERWGVSWQLAALLSLIMGGVFMAWALFTTTPSYLLFLLPLAVMLVGGGTMSRVLKMAERVKGDLKDLQPAHDALTTLVALKTAVGQWPPEPSPDPEPPAPKQP